MRFSSALLGAALVVGLSAPAHAQSNGGLYAGLMGGYNIAQDADVTGTGVNATADFDHGFGVLGNVGWDYGRNKWGNLRSEIELGYRSNGADSASGTGIVGGPGNLSGDVNVLSGMVNALWDLPVNFPVRPYLGAGIGVGHVMADNITRNGTGQIDDSATSFAYQGIAGLGWDINDTWRTNLDYRYFSTLGLDMKTGANVDVDTEYHAHTIMLGFAYKFGAPKPVPAAMAEPMAKPAPAPAPAPVKKPAEPKNFLVFFDFDKTDITPEAQKIIEQAVAYAKEGKLARVELTGHADRSGSNKYNLALSLRRAKAVQDAMIKLGMPSSAIAVSGKGEEEPLVPTPDGVREPQNRRVEILLPQ